MFKNGGFYVNYFLSGFRNQYRGLMRVSNDQTWLYIVSPLRAFEVNLLLDLLNLLVLGRVQPADLRAHSALLRPLSREARHEGLAARCKSVSHPDHHP